MITATCDGSRELCPTRRMRAIVIHRLHVGDLKTVLSAAGGRLIARCRSRPASARAAALNMAALVYGATGLTFRDGAGRGSLRSDALPVV